MFLKLMGAMPGYIYARDNAGIYVNLFVGSRAQIQVAGQKVVINQATGYPWQGDVTITVEPTKTTEFELHIRVPGWCQGPSSSDDLYQPDNRPSDGAARLKVNGTVVENLEIVRGYATLHRRWKSGDVVQLTLDMPVQRIKADVHVEAAKGRVALMRGPIVYCFEGSDNGGAVQNLVIPPGTKFTPKHDRHLLGGVTVLTATTTGLFKTAANLAVSLPLQVTATPYYANANRGTCQMQVWMPEHQDGAKPQNQE
jgi:uncharacterized protein